ncbi:MAG: hypothetical protein GY698_01980 [Actinomycetia bacterium]|nr:hypothetical protein [Actinomycetes bacterium]
MAILAVSAYALGIPDLSGRSLIIPIMAAGSAAMIMSLIQLAVGASLLPRSVMFGSVIALIPWYALTSWVADDSRAAAQRRDRVVVVGPPGQELILQDELSRHPERPAMVVGRLGVEDLAPTGASGTLARLVEDTEATVLVLDPVAYSDPTVVAQAASLHERGLRVRSVALFSEEWLGRIPAEDLERLSLMFDIGEVHRARYGRLKRALDLLVVLPGLAVLGLLIPVVALVNPFANRGSLFYVQDRIGRQGRPFRIYKFRTMTDAPDCDSTWTEEDDNRITRFGNLLRRSHLDELPQFLNVLRGDLSVVGPRPEQAQYVTELNEKLPFYHLRHLVRPGLTGWAQVKYGYGGSDAGALEKLQYEFFYLRHQSLRLDLRILARTARVMVGGQGR